MKYRLAHKVTREKRGFLTECLQLAPSLLSLVRRCGKGSRAHELIYSYALSITSQPSMNCKSATYAGLTLRAFGSALEKELQVYVIHLHFVFNVSLSFCFLFLRLLLISKPSFLFASIPFTAPLQIHPQTLRETSLFCHAAGRLRKIMFNLVQY